MEKEREKVGKGHWGPKRVGVEICLEERNDLVPKVS
jgi:hypothetical protein